MNARTYHVAQIPPLIQKVPIDVDTVRLRQILGDQVADRAEVFGFFFRPVLDVLQVVGTGRSCYSAVRVHHIGYRTACLLRLVLVEAAGEPVGDLRWTGCAGCALGPGIPALAACTVCVLDTIYNMLFNAVKPCASWVSRYVSMAG